MYQAFFLNRDVHAYEAPIFIFPMAEFANIKVRPPQSFYFLSRPRRFGKSLTVSTLRCLFQGKKDLFEGLWITQNTDWDWKPHPVILFDFNSISHDTPENLNLCLKERFQNLARENSIELDTSTLKGMFRELILSLHEKSGMPVVILIDEYGKPLIDHLKKGPDAMAIAKANRDILKQFLGVIKDGDVSSVLRFVVVGFFILITVGAGLAPAL